jgi:hypothetical protein
MREDHLIGSIVLNVLTLKTLKLMLHEQILRNHIVKHYSMLCNQMNEFLIKDSRESSKPLEREAWRLTLQSLEDPVWVELEAERALIAIRVLHTNGQNLSHSLKLVVISSKPKVDVIEGNRTEVKFWALTCEVNNRVNCRSEGISHIKAFIASQVGQ